MARGGGFDMGQIMKQAQQMMKQQEKVQDELRERIVEADAGGGMVTAYVNGVQEVVKLTIEEQVIDPDDKEMLEDLVLAAIRQAMEKSRELAQEEMAKVTGGLGLPGLF